MSMKYFGKQELVNNSNLSRKSNKFPLILELLNFLYQLLRFSHKGNSYNCHKCFLSAFLVVKTSLFNHVGEYNNYSFLFVATKTIMLKLEVGIQTYNWGKVLLSFSKV